MIAGGWLLLLSGFALVTLLCRRLGAMPILCQLLLALALPLLSLTALQPAALLQPGWVHWLYSLSFALVMGAILADIADSRLSLNSLKIALPSFAVPFVCGLLCAGWLLTGSSAVSRMAIGFLFALTAIPVLFLYLQSIRYPLQDMADLLQAAILIDILCWGLFALAQPGPVWQMLLLPLSLGCLPLLLYGLKLRHEATLGVLFFVILAVLQVLGFNALLFGVSYALVMARLGLRIRMPLPAAGWSRVQWYLCVPVLLACGALQIDMGALDWQQASLWLPVFLLAPVLAKLVGNWLGLSWAWPHKSRSVRWQASVLLNIRGLTEVVFLNVLLAQGLIGSLLYFVFLLMSVTATLLPAVLGIRLIKTR